MNIEGYTLPDDVILPGMEGTTTHKRESLFHSNAHEDTVLMKEREIPPNYNRGSKDKLGNGANNKRVLDDLLDSITTIVVPPPVLLATEAGLVLLALQQPNLFNVYTLGAVATSYVMYKQHMI